MPPILQCLQPKYILSKFLPLFTHIRGIFQVKLSCQIGGAWTGLLQKSDNIQPLHQKESLGLYMVLRIAFHEGFSHLPGRLGHFADNNSIPWNQPTIFHFSYKPDCNSTAEVRSFILRTALSAIRFVSDRWCVEVR